jgi:hypothetical protein
VKHVQTGNRAEADELVRRFHYSHRPILQGSLYVTWHDDGGLFGDSGPAWAACVFGIPFNLKTEGKTLELCRVVRDEIPGRPPLSGLIAASCRIIKQRHLADLLISYADTGQNHHGGLYRAASWDYIGLRPGSDLVVIQGVPIHERTALYRYGTKSLVELRSLLSDETINTSTDAPKHLYAKALTKTGRRDLEAIRVRLGPRMG